MQQEDDVINNIQKQDALDQIESAYNVEEEIKLAYNNEEKVDDDKNLMPSQQLRQYCQ